MVVLQFSYNFDVVAEGFEYCIYLCQHLAWKLSTGVCKALAANGWLVIFILGKHLGSG